jgi:hypothetical protein
MLETVLASLAAPQPAQDALADAMARVLRSGTLPETGGVPVTILVRTTVTDLENRTGIALTGTGTPISIGKLLQLAGDARLLPVFCTDTGGILNYGRERRLAGKGQRLALAARDGGCSFPGCDRPAAWTEVHHIKAWLDGGLTNIGNMCLLCRYHHRQFEAAGWQVFMADGLPTWIPPAWLDPERRPIRNTAHHLDDITFEAPSCAS